MQFKSSLCRTQRKRGFNLVEAAIVLGIVGLVIGGLWAAAASISETRRRNDTYQDILQIVKNVQNAFGLGMTKSGTLVPFLITSGIAPSHLVRNSSSMKTLWDGIITSQINTSQDWMNLTFLSVPRGACIDLVTRMAQTRTGVVTLVNTCQQPANIDLVAAESACSSDANNIVWYFPLHGETVDVSGPTC